MRTQANTRYRPQARENVSDQVMIGFSFASDWLRKWREIFRPITESNKAKPMKSRITFHTQLKTAQVSDTKPQLKVEYYGEYQYQGSFTNHFWPGWLIPRRSVLQCWYVQ